ncbi:MAG: hypothetical protein V4727_13825 [Verrucomicrobiota bacterium]
MKIKEHWKYRIASLISFVGLIMIILTIGPLFDYHEETSAYLEKMEPLLDQLENYSSKIQPDPQFTNLELNKISTEIDRARFFNKPNLKASRVPKYPQMQFFMGFSFLMLGLYYSEKYKPKPKEKTPDAEPTNPWDSLPAPELKKNPAIHNQD